MCTLDSATCCYSAPGTASSMVKEVSVFNLFLPEIKRLILDAYLLPCSFDIFLIFEMFKDLTGKDWSVLLSWMYGVGIKIHFVKKSYARSEWSRKGEWGVRQQRRTSTLLMQSGPSEQRFEHSRLWYKPTWMVTYLETFSVSLSLSTPPHYLLSDGHSAAGAQMLLWRARNVLCMCHPIQNKKKNPLDLSGLPSKSHRSFANDTPQPCCLLGSLIYPILGLSWACWDFSAAC